MGADWSTHNNGHEGSLRFIGTADWHSEREERPSAGGPGFKNLCVSKLSCAGGQAKPEFLYGIDKVSHEERFSRWREIASSLERKRIWMYPSLPEWQETIIYLYCTFEQITVLFKFLIRYIYIKKNSLPKLLCPTLCNWRQKNCVWKNCYSRICSWCSCCTSVVNIHTLLCRISKTTKPRTSRQQKLQADAVKLHWNNNLFLSFAIKLIQW